MSEAIRYDGGLTVALPVIDFDVAINWYEQVLGFKLQYRMDDIGWCELESSVANVTVGLSQVEAPDNGGATPTFGVQDIDAAKGVLESNSVRIDGDIVTIENMVRFLTFYDPDNNTLMFAQTLQSSE